MPFVYAQAVVTEEYDAIVVGSGAGGGQMAYTLSMNGARVLMLEAGRKYDASEAAMFQTPELAPLRGAAVGAPLDAGRLTAVRRRPALRVALLTLLCEVAGVLCCIYKEHGVGGANLSRHRVDQRNLRVPDQVVSRGCG